MDANEISYIVSKAQELDAKDPIRRAIIDLANKWWKAGDGERRKRIESALEGEARRLAY